MASLEICHHLYYLVSASSPSHQGVCLTPWPVSTVVGGMWDYPDH